ncbi:MAG: NAD-dependent epimerase/dehydratase family protein [Legionellaceae bacterium]|nr:NAD-dependent epimerase/dehydratase family protein [Legionellaceae bacterium]
MNILITGSEGSVGKHLVEEFLKKGYSVLSPPYSELDLTNEERVSEYFGQHKIDVIIHSATTLRQDTSYPAKTCENNLRMFFNLQKQLTPKIKLINFGSGSEYDRRYWYRKMPEEFFDQHIPEDDHSYSKYLISKYIRDTEQSNVINLRIFGIYGRYEDYRFKFISNAIVKNLLKLPIVINQNVIYDYIYINDFFRLVEILVNKEPKNKTLNATTTQSIDLVSIAKLVNDVSHYESEIHVLHSGIGVEYSGDNKKLLSDIGPFEFMTHQEAIADLYHYYKSIEVTLDVKAVVQDNYLNYAKKLRTYFKSSNQ